MSPHNTHAKTVSISSIVNELGALDTLEYFLTATSTFVFDGIHAGGLCVMGLRHGWKPSQDAAPHTGTQRRGGRRGVPRVRLCVAFRMSKMSSHGQWVSTREPSPHSAASVRSAQWGSLKKHEHKAPRFQGTLRLETIVPATITAT